MIIQSTKKLLDELNIEHQEILEYDDALFSWHANLITINRRKTVVMINNKNRFIVVMYGLKARDFKRIDEVIINALRETLLDECIKEEVVEKYISQSPKCIFTRTKNRAEITKLNHACNTVKLFFDRFDSETVDPKMVNKIANGYIVKIEESGYEYPYRQMYKDLEPFGEPPIISCRAVELKIVMGLEKLPCEPINNCSIGYYFQETT